MTDFRGDPDPCEDQKDLSARVKVTICMREGELVEVTMPREASAETMDRVRRAIDERISYTIKSPNGHVVMNGNHILTARVSEVPDE